MSMNEFPQQLPQSLICRSNLDESRNDLEGSRIDVLSVGSHTVPGLRGSVCRPGPEDFKNNTAGMRVRPVGGGGCKEWPERRGKTKRRL